MHLKIYQIDMDRDKHNAKFRELSNTGADGKLTADASTYDEVFDGLFKDFFLEPRAEREELAIYTYDITINCIRRCIEECVGAIRAVQKGEEVLNPETYFVPVR